MANEKTFLAIKPEAYARGDTVEIIRTLTQLIPDAKCLAMKAYTPSEELAKKHYADLSDKPFFPDLIKSFTAGTILGMVWEADGMVARARKAMGATDPKVADEGTIRKKFGKHIGDNAIHGSDTEPGSADREVSIHFPDGNFAEIADPAAKAQELCQISA